MLGWGTRVRVTFLMVTVLRSVGDSYPSVLKSFSEEVTGVKFI